MENRLECGLSQERLDRITSAIEKDVAEEKYDGGVVLVARHGIIGLQKAIGFADRRANRACRPDDVFKIFSIAKGFIDVLILSHVEKGNFALTTRVCDIIPEFKGELQEKVTIFHLLTHTAGGPMFEPNLIGENSLDASIKMNLVTTPGEKISYSVRWSHVLLAEILRRIDGGKRNLRQIYLEDLLNPLQMTETDFISREDLIPRIVPIVVYDIGEDNFLPPGSLESFNLAHTDEEDVPGWGSLSTINDMFRFAEMLRRGGELDGIRILSPAMVKMATTIQTGTMLDEGLSKMFAEYGLSPFPANIGLNFSIRGTHQPSDMGSLTSPGTFGKFGTGSVGLWIDPEWDVTFIFFSVGLLNGYSNFLRFQRLSDMAMASVI